MMSCNPFKDIDDTLFHDFGRKEVLEEPLDVTNPFKDQAPFDEEVMEGHVHEKKEEL
jgi:hypothetical protein